MAIENVHKVLLLLEEKEVSTIAAAIETAVAVVIIEIAIVVVVVVVMVVIVMVVVVVVIDNHGKGLKVQHIDVPIETERKRNKAMKQASEVVIKGIVGIVVKVVKVVKVVTDNDGKDHKALHREKENNLLTNIKVEIPCHPQHRLKQEE
tara:strand:+ start:210 stop:656 length:447 start_codon:yes stop_codon:yes gene_type:complete